mmetsp:Transcript_11963/g.25702  ORF Transcript_11963/g.25702 Transcript_11963/m.25702 type:complete len:201 (-) Transcript_11963:1006-1608(-)
MPVDFIVGTGDCEDAIEVSPRENLADEDAVNSLHPLVACARRDGDASATAGDCFPSVVLFEEDDAFLHASRMGLFGSSFFPFPPSLSFSFNSACSLIANSRSSRALSSATLLLSSSRCTTRFTYRSSSLSCRILVSSSRCMTFFTYCSSSCSCRNLGSLLSKSSMSSPDLSCNRCGPFDGRGSSSSSSDCHSSHESEEME